ncbi:MAG: ABC transporter permease [Myxococcales bacterium]|nr:ABC transporter permease [Myxococcales bacterium]
MSAVASSEPTTPTDADEEPSTGGARALVEGLLFGVGDPIVYIGQTLRGFADVFRRTLIFILQGKIRWGEVVQQCHEIGNRSVIFIMFTLGFLGMILVFQAGFQAQRITGDLRPLGGLFLQVLLREFAPTITALMIATRVGTGIAAEIGSMVVTEQVDAMRMNAAPPVQYLIVPRFIAGTAMMIALVAIAIVVCFIAGMFTALYGFNVNPRTFVNFSFVTYADLMICMSKALAYGMAIPIVAGHTGLATHGGSAGVGWATTQSVVNCSLTVVVLDFLLSGLSYVFLSM